MYAYVHIQVCIFMYLYFLNSYCVPGTVLGNMSEGEEHRFLPSGS